MSRRERLEVQVTSPYPWRVFWVLLFGAACGYVGLLPYLFQLFATLVNVSMPLPIFVAVQLMQALIIFGLVISVGLLVGDKVGLGTPLLRYWLYRTQRLGARPPMLRFAVLIGAVTGVLTLLLFFLVLTRYLPNWPSEAGVPVWKRLLACLYGAVDEELLLRLFLLSVVLWLLRKIARSDLQSGAVSFWIGNVIVALVFAAAHLPAAKVLMPLTPAVIVAVMSLNTGAGIVFGYLTWSRGLEAAMVAHFTSDLILHLVGPLFATA
jgi:hypothetical protein